MCVSDRLKCPNAGDETSHRRRALRFSNTALLCGIPFAIAALIGAAVAQNQSSVLPLGSAREIVANVCSSCHGIETVTSRRETREGWATIVDTMIGRGAQLNPSQAAEVVSYLARSFPAPGASQASSSSTSGEVVPPVAVAAGLASDSHVVEPSPTNSPTRNAIADWPSINLDPGASRYSPLTQINKANVGRLQEAWTYQADPAAHQRTQGETSIWDFGTSSRQRVTEVTPLVIDGIMYTTTPFGAAIALEGDTGRQIWKYNLGSDQGRPGIRSLSYWSGDARTPAAIYFSTTSGLLLALEAKTGRPLKSFGKDGVLDFAAIARGKWKKLTPTLLSPPVFYKDVLITGMAAYGRDGKGPLGTVRGWNARTGKLLWEFHGVPQPGEPNHESWSGDSWVDRDGAYSWGLQSVDPETGTVFVPLSTAHADSYGVDRPGNNLYGTSLVALDASTGKLKWYFQATHHDLWDADLHHAPVLIRIQQGTKVVPAVAVATKRGLMFMLNRDTGKPVHPVEERAVPTDGFIKGEQPSPTQPFPIRPGPLARDYFSPDELNRITPDQASYCESMLKNGRADPRLPAGPSGLRTGGPYIPFNESGSILFPWTNGGAEWQGMSYDPKLGYLFLMTASMGEVFQVIPGHVPPRVVHYPFRDPNTGWPCNNGPWGELIAVNVNSGEIAWRRPIGDDPKLDALGIHDWGTLLMGGTTSTAGGVTFAGGTIDGKFRAVDSATGADLWSVDVGAAAHSIPLTYLGRDGRQYVATFVSGGSYLGDPVIPAEIRVFALPK